MSRIRTVKPELFLDEELGALTGDHVLLFIGLWTLADREGRLEDRPARIKASLFPYRAVDVDGLLDELSAANKIVRYEADGMELVAIPGFTRHQRPHPKEPASTLPGPGGHKRIERQRWVYFIQAGDGGPIKIGSATDPEARLAGLQTSHPEELRIIGRMPWESRLETGLHRRFSAHRLRGEWFKPDSEILKLAKANSYTDGNGLAVHEVRSIPSSPVGREGKGREGDLGRERDLRAGAPESVRGVDDWPDVPEADPLDVRQVTPGERLAGALQAAGNGPPSDEDAPPTGKVGTRRQNAPEALQEAATAAVRFFGHCAEVCEAKGRAWDGPGNAGRESGIRWYNGAIRDLLDAQKRRGEAPDGPKADAQLRAGYAAFATSTDDWLTRNGWPWAAFAKGFAKWAVKPAPVDKWKGKSGWEPPAQTSA